MVLYYAYRIHHRRHQPNLPHLKTQSLLSVPIPKHLPARLNLKHLMTHHLLLTPPLITLQSYIHGSHDRGILLILIFLLMNASSPFQVARWWLIHFQPRWRRLLTASTVGYLAVFFWCRVYLVWWLVRGWGVYVAQNGAGAAGVDGGCSGVAAATAVTRGKSIQSLPAVNEVIETWKTYRTLRWQCQLGTGTIGVVNSVWWTWAMKKFLARSVRG